MTDEGESRADGYREHVESDYGTRPVMGPRPAGGAEESGIGFRQKKPLFDFDLKVPTWASFPGLLCFDCTCYATFERLPFPP